MTNIRFIVQRHHYVSCIVDAPQSGLTLWKSLSLKRSKPDRRYRGLFLAHTFFSASASFFRRIAFFSVVELFLAPHFALRHPRQIILLFNHCSVTNKLSYEQALGSIFKQRNLDMFEDIKLRLRYFGTG